MGTVFVEMSSLAALTRHLGMKTKYIKANLFDFYYDDFNSL